MNASVPASRHWLRWLALAIVTLLVALAVALVVYVHNLLQPQRFTALLENDLAVAGLRLNMDVPAEPTLLPRPGVQLQGFSLTNIGAQTPVLQANGATVVVPWRALLHGEVAIERVDVDAPHIDLGELEALFARLPHRAGPPRLPTITTGIHMSQGTLTRNGAPLLFDFSLTTGALAPNQTFQLDASARSAAGRRLTATLATVPSAVENGVIGLDALRIDVAEQHGAALQLAGTGSWHGGEDLALHLEGSLRHRPFAPLPTAATSAAKAGASAAPAASLASPPANQDVSDKVVFDVTPARAGTPITLALKLDGADTHADLHLQPTEFGRWWTRLLIARPGESSGPLPFTGTMQARRLDLGWLKATDISFEADPDLAPASAATAAAPPSAGAAASAH
ncbi:MAG: AsmA family protein [Proteobacteria bacterium]|nr:AsmA family protein [Pseudomonadota bacterium]